MRTIRLIMMSLILTGCGIGGYWMNGDPSGGRNITPYLQRWEKPGISSEQRKDDSVLCGGTRNEIKPFYPQVDEEQLMLPEETIWKTRERLGIAWVKCMRGRGYHHLPEGAYNP